MHVYDTVTMAMGLRGALRIPGGARTLGSVPAGGCFVEGTTVLTARGNLPIESLVVGDLVWAWREHTNEPGWHRISDTFVRERRPVLRLVLETDDGRRDEILSTAEHPFWVVSRGWTAAQELELGERVQTAESIPARVASLSWGNGLWNVYNIEVDDAHTYFVGSVGAWVHNVSSISGAAKGTPASTPVGRKGDPLRVPDGTNAPAEIGGRPFSGHSLDRMQRQGITPTTVDSVIRNGQATTGNVPGTTAHYDATNNITVITNSKTGNVITVDYGMIKQ